MDKKAIDTAYIPKSFYEKADADIRNRLEKGELVDYKSEFVNSISSQMKAQELKEQKARIMNTPSSKESATSHTLKNLNHDQKQGKPDNTGSFKPELQQKPKPNPNSKNEIPKDRGSDREMTMPQGKLK